LTSTILVYCGASQVIQNSNSASSLAYVIEVIAGISLLVGLWTPAAGITIAAVEIWRLFTFPGNSLAAITLASLGLTIAMIGPGMWSVDARLYGRKHLQDPRP